MDSHICDTCQKVLNNYINWFLGIETPDKSLGKPCTINRYPHKSCREHIALNIIQDEFVNYLERKANPPQIDRSKREDSQFFYVMCTDDALYGRSSTLDDVTCKNHEDYIAWLDRQTPESHSHLKIYKKLPRYDTQNTES